MLSKPYEPLISPMAVSRTAHVSPRCAASIMACACGDSAPLFSNALRKSSGVSNAMLASSSLVDISCSSVLMPASSTMSSAVSISAVSRATLSKSVDPIALLSSARLSSAKTSPRNWLSSVVMLGVSVSGQPSIAIWSDETHVFMFSTGTSAWTGSIKSA